MKLNDLKAPRSPHPCNTPRVEDISGYKQISSFTIYSARFDHVNLSKAFIAHTSH